MEIDTMIHSSFIFSFIYSYAITKAWYNLDWKVGENCKTSWITFYSDKSDAMKVLRSVNFFVPLLIYDILSFGRIQED